MVTFGNTADRSHKAPHGTALLPDDLTDALLAASPVLTSTDSLLIDRTSR